MEITRLHKEPQTRYYVSMLRIIFYVILVVLILSFFGVSLQNIVHSPAGQENFGYLGDLIISGIRLIANVIVDFIASFAHLFS